MKIRELADIVEARYGDPQAFMVNLRNWMHESKITQARLGVEAGFDPSNINRWMRGHISCSLKNMIILDEALERILDGQEVESAHVVG